jgi:hypothetical protein
MKGRMEKFDNLIIRQWKNGRVEGWKDGREEEFDDSTMEDIYHGDTEGTKEARKWKNVRIR